MKKKAVKHMRMRSGIAPGAVRLFVVANGEQNNANQ